MQSIYFATVIPMDGGKKSYSINACMWRTKKKKLIGLMTLKAQLKQQS